MVFHRNAKLGLAGRLALVQAIEGGMSMRAAAAAFSVSPATAHRWWHRWVRGGRGRRARALLVCLIAPAARARPGAAGADLRLPPGDGLGASRAPATRGPTPRRLREQRLELESGQLAPSSTRKMTKPLMLPSPGHSRLWLSQRSRGATDGSVLWQGLPICICGQIAC